jgi:hypothetical protein
MGDWTNGPGDLDPFDIHVERAPDAVDSAVEAGTGGDPMAFWDQTMEEKYDFVSSAKIDQWADESSFAVFDEAGWLHPTWGKYDRLAERGIGWRTEGEVLDADGDALAGTVELRDGEGDVIDSASVEGSFVAAHGPPDGVEGGTDADPLGDLGVRFLPDIDGIELVQDWTAPFEDLGDIQYGDVTGTITDVEGTPVLDELVTAAGANTLTDQNGEYALVGPGGTTFEMTSLRGEFTKEVTLTAGETDVFDWTFAGVQVTVTIPGGKVARGVKVKLDVTGEALLTNPAGRVFFTQVPPETADAIVTIADELEEPVNVGGEASVRSIQRNLGIGVSGTVNERATGESIDDIDCRILGEAEFTGRSSRDGSYALGSTDTGELEVIFARADRRYQETVFEIDVVEDDLETINPELRRQTTPGNAV